MAIHAMNESDFSKAIINSLKEAAKSIVDEESEKAANTVKKRVAALADKVCLGLAQHYSYQTDGMHINIKIDVEKLGLPIEK